MISPDHKHSTDSEAIWAQIRAPEFVLEDREAFLALLELRFHKARITGQLSRYHTVPGPLGASLEPDSNRSNRNSIEFMNTRICTVLLRTKLAPTRTADTNEIHEELITTNAYVY
ncbi:unnamed protein product [Echinostoma caproni]|uniref:Transposase n=1 Tax=Echinostoma caproni TaxID=27848 RepID=A0A183A1X2_9TREM|nr:unnamed protein product [Echinostoma caproni]